ncbi:hypothetical protein [Vibrio furnissii]|uniref:hypothetical protein n=1 Tax=Vibrio furnissii TaxID=29494 RepID=UPI001EECF327|nr:hypothetical protein [Vibrio furnissii]
MLPTKCELHHEMGQTARALLVKHMEEVALMNRSIDKTSANKKANKKGPSSKLRLSEAWMMGACAGR